MSFNKNGNITGFGLKQEKIREIIDLGSPFMTSGCLGPNGQVACNRPFGNCLPDTKQWNYPYKPNEEELDLIKKNIFDG